MSQNNTLSYDSLIYRLLYQRSYFAAEVRAKKVVDEFSKVADAKLSGGSLVIAFKDGAAFTVPVESNRRKDYKDNEIPSTRVYFDQEVEPLYEAARHALKL